MARRVNSKFLIIFSAVVLLSVATLYVIGGPLQNLLHPSRGKDAIVQGDAAGKAGDEAKTPKEIQEHLEEAVRAYQVAAGTDTKNIELYIKLGDVSNRRTQYCATPMDV